MPFSVPVAPWGIRNPPSRQWYSKRLALACVPPSVDGVLKARVEVITVMYLTDGAL